MQYIFLALLLCLVVVELWQSEDFLRRRFWDHLTEFLDEYNTKWYADHRQYPDHKRSQYDNR